MRPDDSYWRRPDPQDPARNADIPPGARGDSAQAPYPPTPPMVAPPAGWRPRHVSEPSPPRQLPPQDHALIDDDENRSAMVTRAIGIGAGLVLLVLLCVSCGRHML